MEVEHYEAIVMVFDCTPTLDVSLRIHYGLSLGQLGNGIC